FDERFTVWSTVHRRRSRGFEASKFPDLVAQRIDDLRGQEFSTGQHYINHHYFSVLFAPSRGLDRFFDRFHSFTSQHGLSQLQALWLACETQFSRRHAFAMINAELDQYIAQFEESLDAFAGTIDRMGLIRLENATLLEFLHDCCSPASAVQ